MSYAGSLDVVAGAARWAVSWADALEGLENIPDASVDAVVSDPPYASLGSSRSALGRRTTSVLSAHDSQFFEAWLAQHVAAWARVLKPAGAIWITIDWHGALSFERVCGRLGLKQPTIGVWDRESIAMGHVLRKQYECFAVVGMPAFERLSGGEPDVWRVPWAPAQRKTGHPAEKPVELMRRAVRLVCRPDALVLDPFCGSGSTGLAALAEGCRFVGIERESEYCDIARARLAGATTPAQPDLFAATGGR